MNSRGAHRQTEASDPYPPRPSATPPEMCAANYLVVAPTIRIPSPLEGEGAATQCASHVLRERAGFPSRPYRRKQQIMQNPITPGETLLEEYLKPMGIRVSISGLASDQRAYPQVSCPKQCRVARTASFTARTLAEGHQIGQLW